MTNQSGLDYETQVQVLRSPDLMAEVAELLQQTYPGIDYPTLLENLTIARVGDTKIIEVRYQGSDPLQIQVILDTLSQVYLKYSLEERQTNLRQGIQFIESQLPPLQTRVDDLQKQLESFRLAYNFIDPDTQAEQISQQADRLKTERLEIDQQLAQAVAYASQLTGTQGAQAVLQEAPVYQNLYQTLQDLEAKIAAESTRFQPGSLTIQTLQEQRRNLLPLITAEAERVHRLKTAEANNNIAVLEARSRTLAAAEGQLVNTQQTLPSLTRSYSDLQRELQIAIAGLNRFLETKENLQIEAAQTEIPWQLIEAPSQPEQPISPNVQRSLILGTVASLLLGVGAAMLIEKLDTVYRAVEDLKTETKLPLLGTLPYQSELDETYQGKSHWAQLQSWLTQKLPSLGRESGSYYGYGASQFLESLRVLQTNLQLLGTDRPVQSITISSSMPGEGKSTLSRHLAQTAATMGKRVLLVDVDLRRPKLHKSLGLNNTQGMSELLSGNATKSEVIHKTMPLLEFYTITAGSIPPDPIKLLSSHRMQLLIQEFEQEFDLVIYDAPPLVGLADATLIAPHTDGLMLVARLNKTERPLLKHALENLKLARIPVLGLVANGVQSGSGGGYYQYYNYRYEEAPATQNGYTSRAKEPEFSTTSLK